MVFLLVVGYLGETIVDGVASKTNDRDALGIDRNTGSA
jgi:hypothetical protein